MVHLILFMLEFINNDLQNPIDHKKYDLLYKTIESHVGYKCRADHILVSLSTSKQSQYEN